MFLSLATRKPGGERKAEKKKKKFSSRKRLRDPNLQLKGPEGREEKIP